MKNDNFQKINKYLMSIISIPALFFGVYTMIFLGVPKSIWLKNIIFNFSIILLFLGYLSIYKSQNQIAKEYPSLRLVFLLLVLLLPFLSEDMNDVRRWITLFGFQLNIGLIITPLLIIEIEKNRNIWSSLLTFLIGIGIFLVQPDASQVMAFGLASALILWTKCKVFYIRILLISITLLASAFAWINLDNLPPVDYVERIQQVSVQINLAYYFFSLLSLLLLLYPFFFSHSKSIVSSSLGLYFALLILATFLGNFPVLIMGYGVSPMIGYYFALTWLIRNH